MLSKSLKQYRTKNKLVQREIALAFNIPLKRYASYEEGRAEPPIQEYFRMCEIMQVNPVLFYNEGISYYESKKPYSPLLKIQSLLKRTEQLLTDAAKIQNEIKSELP